MVLAVAEPEITTEFSLVLGAGAAEPTYTSSSFWLQECDLLWLVAGKAEQALLSALPFGC